jgi:hypothetical protein
MQNFEYLFVGFTCLEILIDIFQNIKVINKDNTDVRRVLTRNIFK